MTGMRIACRPLTDWPGQLRTWSQQRPSPFSAPWTDTQELLEREARMIGGRELVIQLAITEAEIRRDGWPYARAHTRHPGVTIVVPDTRHGRLSWSTDRYYWWQANVRAVAKSMEALRAADRHGVMQGRQYAGFRELGAGESDEDWNPTLGEAAQWMSERLDMHVGDHQRIAGLSRQSYRDLIHNPDLRTKAYRALARVLHPDAGGDPGAFRRLEQAKAFLDKHGAAA